MEFPARVTLLSGAVIELSNASHMEALPLGAALRADGPNAYGTYLYQEVQASMAGEAKRLRVELQAAADALAVAAEVVRASGSAFKASQTKQAADRAKAALEDTVHA